MKYNDLEDMVYRMEITYDEFIDILDMKHIGAKTIGYTILPRINEISDSILLLKSLLQSEVKVNITIDDIRLRSNFTSNKFIKFTQKLFLYTKLGFTQTHSGVLGHIEIFVEKVAGP